MSLDPIDELGRRLFSAGHVERAPDELRERLLGIRPAAVRDAGKNAPPLRPPSKRRSARLWWLLAAAALGGSLLVLPQVLQRDSQTGAPLISAERATPSPPAMLRTPGEREAPDTRPSLPRAAAHAEPEAQSTATPARRGSGQVRPPAPAAPSSRAGSSDVATHAPSRAPASAPRATLAEELDWLKRARSALRAGDSGRALELLDAYDNELGGADLRDEASVLRIEALGAAGRHAEAHALAERFTSQNPNSPLVDRARTFTNRPETPPDKRAEP